MQLPVTRRLEGILSGAVANAMVLIGVPGVHFSPYRGSILS